MSVNGNDTRRAVLLTLVESGEDLSPSDIGDRIDESRQTVKYHLDELRSMGLIVADDGDYHAQPVFTDDDFEEEFIGLLSRLVPKVEARLELPLEMPPEKRTQAVFNCLRLFVAHELLEPVPDDD